VLLVDDNSDVRLHLGNLLVQMGFQVEAFGDPRPLLERTRWTAPTVLLLDMRMPILSGLEVQKALNALAQTVPIIFISGESEPHEVVKAFKGGASDFLIKPFGRAELSLALEAAFDREAADRQRGVRLERLRQHCRELSTRERDVLSLILQGYSNKALGEQLQIQAGTVKKHRAAIYEKFMVDDLSELLNLFEGIERSDGLLD
jgi:FixJ family two-component response regulator